MARLRAVGLEPRAPIGGQLSGAGASVALARATVLDPSSSSPTSPPATSTTSGRRVLELLEQMNAQGLTSWS
jgi:hypothetical protein